MLEEVKEISYTAAFRIGILHGREVANSPMTRGADNHRLVVILLRRELPDVFGGRKRPKGVLAKKGGIRTGRIDSVIKSFQLFSGEKHVDTAKGDEGSVLDREAFWKLEFGNERGGGEEVEVLLPMAFEVRIFGVVRSRTNVRRENAGQGKEVVFRNRIPDKQPTALLDQVRDERFSVKRADGAPLPRGPRVVEGHRKPVFPLLRTVGPQMPEEFAVCSTTFEPSKRDCVGALLHLGSWRELVGRLPRTGRVSFCGARPLPMGVTVLNDGANAKVSGVLIGSIRKREDDAGTAHEHDGESCGASCERTPGF